MNKTHFHKTIIFIASLLLSFTSPQLTASAQSGISQYRWSQGQPQIRMIPVSKGICFLSGITGRWKGFGEAVSIQNINGYWTLGGKSQQKDVAGEAYCVQFSAIRIAGSYTWTTKPGFKQFHFDSPYSAGVVGPSTKVIGVNGDWCYLTGVSGRLEDDTTIEVTSNRDGNPIISLDFNGNDVALRGEFGCLHSIDGHEIDYYDSVTSWYQGEEVHYGYSKVG